MSMFMRTFRSTIQSGIHNVYNQPQMRPIVNEYKKDPEFSGCVLGSIGGVSIGSFYGGHESSQVDKSLGEIIEVCGANATVGALIGGSMGFLHRIVLSFAILSVPVASGGYMLGKFLEE